MNIKREKVYLQKKLHMQSEINTAILKLIKRAEKYSMSELVDTFVDVGSLFTLLMVPDHQILYGRRGTGKTHVLNYLCSELKKDKCFPIYIDMRMIGSTGGIYSDPTIPFSERATRLLVDVIGYIHDRILEIANEGIDENIHMGTLGPLLEDLNIAISEIRISGEVVKETSTMSGCENEDSLSFGIGKSPSLNLLSTEKDINKKEQKVVNSGIENHRIHFPSIREMFEQILKVIHPYQLWIIFDEWAEIPLDLQPFLGDLMRRCLFPLRGLTVKIGAIEHRTNLKIQKSTAEYIGIETGADTASVNLDEFMVFDNNEYLSLDFFRNLLFKHINPNLNEDRKYRFVEDLITDAFTQTNAFEELVRASEGVPRDAINILVNAATKAMGNKISIKNIRDASRIWYNRDKEKAISSSPEAVALLRWIVDEVIGKRNARAFLLRTDVENTLIDYLYDSRIIHIIKESISGRDTPGVRYNAYSIDYGCFVDLINTSKAPRGLFQVEIDGGDGESYVNVPHNDYRAIRRAILNLDEFFSSQI